MLVDHNAPIFERVKGYFPISIGTSLAIEGLFGFEVEEGEIISKSDSPPILTVDALWLNVNTLFRNYINAFEGHTYLSVDPFQLVTYFIQEAKQLEDLLRIDAPSLKVSFYYCHYRDTKKRYPNATLREPRTQRQVEYESVRSSSMKFILDRQTRGELPFHIDVFPHRLDKRDSGNVLVLTNNVLDLLAQRTTPSLKLLESHTGLIKPKTEWNSKYNNGKQYPHFPFIEQLLPILGDSEVFHPQGIKVRRAILTMAEENRWTVITTVDKIRYNISRLPESEEKTTLEEFFKLTA